MSDDIGSVERIIPLPDRRLLLLLRGGVVRILPVGLAQPLNRGEARGAADIADVAVDPEFSSNRFVYFASVEPTSQGRAVSVVRMRELADRLGEPATILPALPIVGEGAPAMTIGADRRIYLAMPSASDKRGDIGSYDGLVLRVRSDGTAAGYERAGSPVLSTGTSQPTAFGWLDSGLLLLASRGAVREPALRIVPLQVAERVWPGATIPLPIPGGLADGIKGIAVSSSVPRLAGQSPFYVITDNPERLYIVRMVTSPTPSVVSMGLIPLGSRTAHALATDSDGDLIVAATDDADAIPRVSLLRLHPQ